jgi:arabinogalactan endo-1,4-beta-galactosidase
MNIRKTIAAATLLLGAAICGHAQEKFVGGDISLLPNYSKSTFKTHDGTVMQPLELFKQEKLNTMRVRLFVDPSKYTASDKDPNACQDFDYVLSLAKQIKDAGFKFMLDFHYSDTWADPAKQWTPADWASLSDQELYERIYTYTKQVLQQLKDAGVEPEFIQTGNEISYGMMWGAYGTAESKRRTCYVNSNSNWDYFTTLLKRAGEACREVCPDAKIVIHIERVAQPSVLTQFYDRMKNANLDYDIIGLSYYPYYHGTLADLRTALDKVVEKNYGKPIMIVETGYSYAWAVGGTTNDYSATYPYSDEGQRQFTADLIELLNQYPSVTGLFWWWMEYNAYNNSSLSNWYNAPLFDSRTGCATSALSELKNFLGDGAAINTVAADNVTDDADTTRFYNMRGEELSASNLPHANIVIRKTATSAQKLLVK